MNRSHVSIILLLLISAFSVVAYAPPTQSNCNCNEKYGDCEQQYLACEHQFDSTVNEQVAAHQQHPCETEYNSCISTIHSACPSCTENPPPTNPSPTPTQPAPGTPLYTPNTPAYPLTPETPQSPLTSPLANPCSYPGMFSQKTICQAQCNKPCTSLSGCWVCSSSPKTSCPPPTLTKDVCDQLCTGNSYCQLLDTNPSCFTCVSKPSPANPTNPANPLTPGGTPPSTTPGGTNLGGGRTFGSGDTVPPPSCPTCEPIRLQIQQKIIQQEPIAREIQDIQKEQTGLKTQRDKTAQDLQQAQNDLSDFNNPNKWIEENGKRTTSSDLQMKDAARKEKQQAYSGGQMTAQDYQDFLKNFDNYWNNLPAGEKDRLRKKKQDDLNEKIQAAQDAILALDDKIDANRIKLQNLNQQLAQLKTDIAKLQNDYDICTKNCNKPASVLQLSQTYSALFNPFLFLAPLLSANFQQSGTSTLPGYTPVILSPPNSLFNQQDEQTQPAPMSFLSTMSSFVAHAVGLQSTPQQQSPQTPPQTPRTSPPSADDIHVVPLCEKFAEAHEDEAECTQNCQHGVCTPFNLRDYVQHQPYGALVIKEGTFSHPITCWKCGPETKNCVGNEFSSAEACKQTCEGTCEQENGCFACKPTSILEDLCPPPFNNIDTCNKQCFVPCKRTTPPGTLACYGCETPIDHACKDDNPNHFSWDDCQTNCPTTGGYCSPLGANTFATGTQSVDKTACYECKKGFNPDVQMQAPPKTPDDNPEPTKCEEIKNYWEKDDPSTKQPDFFAQEANCKKTCQSPKLCKKSTPYVAGKTFTCWSCQNPSCEDLTVSPYGRLFGDPPTCNVKCRMLTPPGTCHPANIPSQISGLQQYVCFACVQPKVQQAPPQIPLYPPVTPHLGPQTPGNDGGGTTTGGSDGGTSFTPNGGGSSSPPPVDCGSICSSKGLDSTPDTSGILAQLNQKKCVSGASLNIKGTKFSPCTNTCYQKPEIFFNTQVPVCQTDCGPVNCDDSKTCPCPGKENCELHVSCSWGGWKQQSDNAYTPIIGVST